LALRSNTRFFRLVQGSVHPGRQPHDEARAARLVRLTPDLPAMGFDDVPRNRQTKPRAVVSRREKRFEQPRPRLVAHPRAVVRDENVDPTGLRTRAHGHGEVATAWHGLTGVAQQVVDDLTDL